jgi:hypothetical protein
MTFGDPIFADDDTGVGELLHDWLDDDFIDAVIAVGEGLPGNVVPITSAREARDQQDRKREVNRKMQEAARRTQERRSK